MVERTEPGSVGVVAGRVVGVLTVALTVVALLTTQETFYAALSARNTVIGLGFLPDCRLPSLPGSMTKL